MKYTILKEFYPNSNIWVSKLNDNDPEYIYENEEEAFNKITELIESDGTRKYKISLI